MRTLAIAWTEPLPVRQVSSATGWTIPPAPERASATAPAVCFAVTVLVIQARTRAIALMIAEHHQALKYQAQCVVIRWITTATAFPTAMILTARRNHPPAAVAISFVIQGKLNAIAPSIAAVYPDLKCATTGWTTTAMV